MRTSLSFRVLLTAAVVSFLAPALPASAQQQSDSVAPLLWQPSMNVFRRFTVDREKMIEFYGKALALKALPPIGLGGGGQMTRFQVGTSEIKLTASLPSDRQYASGGVREVTGLRVLTLFFPNEAELTARFTAHGYPVPEFRSVSGSANKVAMVRDPGGEWVELVVTPGAAASTFDRIELGLTVSDIEKSRVLPRVRRARGAAAGP